MKKYFLMKKREYSFVYGYWREIEYLYMKIENFWMVLKISDWNVEVNLVYVVVFVVYV